jgi:hypothetical protein
MTNIQRESPSDALRSLSGLESIVVLPVAHQLGAARVPISSFRKPFTADVVASQDGRERECWEQLDSGGNRTQPL